MPLIQAFDGGEPSPVVQHARKFRDPRAHAVCRALGYPEPNLRLALDRVLPAIALFDAHAEDAADGTSSHHGSVLFRAPAVRPWRHQSVSGLIVCELNGRQLTRRLHVGRTIRNEPGGGIHAAHGLIPLLPEL